MNNTHYFEHFHFHQPGVGQLTFEADHVSEDSYVIRVQDKEYDELFKGTLEELIERLKPKVSRAGVMSKYAEEMNERYTERDVPKKGERR